MSVIGDLEAALRRELGKVVVGGETTVRALTLALVARGHVLLQGAPGLGKTLLAKTFAAAARRPCRRCVRRTSARRTAAAHRARGSRSCRARSRPGPRVAHGRGLEALQQCQRRTYRHFELGLLRRHRGIAHAFRGQRDVAQRLAVRLEIETRATCELARGQGRRHRQTA